MPAQDYPRLFANDQLVARFNKNQDSWRPSASIVLYVYHKLYDREPAYYMYNRPDLGLTVQRTLKDYNVAKRVSQQ